MEEIITYMAVNALRAKFELFLLSASPRKPQWNLRAPVRSCRTNWAPDSPQRIKIALVSRWKTMASPKKFNEFQSKSNLSDTPLLSLKIKLFWARVSLIFVAIKLLLDQFTSIQPLMNQKSSTKPFLSSIEPQ